MKTAQEIMVPSDLIGRLTPEDTIRIAKGMVPRSGYAMVGRGGQIQGILTGERLHALDGLESTLGQHKAVLEGAMIVLPGTPYEKLYLSVIKRNRRWFIVMDAETVLGVVEFQRLPVQPYEEHPEDSLLNLYSQLEPQRPLLIDYLCSNGHRYPSAVARRFAGFPDQMHCPQCALPLAARTP